MITSLLSWWCNNKQWIDVVVDIDDTIVYSPGPIDMGELGSYRLAHGAVEFLVALDNVPGVRISFYSGGTEIRNEELVSRVALEIEKRGVTLQKKMEVFSVPLGAKKRLKGLKKGLSLGRAILVDDRGNYAGDGEEKNMLKVYESVVGLQMMDDTRASSRVYKARLNNNLVRALGMILFCIERGGNDLVTCLSNLQWDGGSYLHQASNAQEIYEKGLAAMRAVNPEFCLCLAQEQGSSDIQPWSDHEKNDKLFHSNVYSPFRKLFC